MEAACMNIILSDDNLDKRDSTDNGNCFIITWRMIWFPMDVVDLTVRFIKRFVRTVWKI